MAIATTPDLNSPTVAVADASLVAAFLAKGGQVSTIQPAPAYGVDPNIDRERRAAERAQRMVENAEHASERYMENVREAYHVGGRGAAVEAMNGRF